MKGDPSGYYKVDDGEKLSGKEIKNLVYGKIMSGYHSGYQWSISSSKDGNIKLSISKNGSILFKDNGKESIEGDSLCGQYEARFGGFKDCGEIFYNPKGNDQDKSRYLTVADHGIFPFSVEDAATQ